MFGSIARAQTLDPVGSDTSRVTSGQNLDVMDVLSHPAENGSPPALQTHAYEKSGAICKIHAKYSARAARSLAMQIRKSHPESHPCKIQRTQLGFVNTRCQITSGVTSMQNSEDSSHI